MRRRNVWDDLGDLSALDSPSAPPPPPTFEASPLSRQVLPNSASTLSDPSDPPPPFPPDADRARSPPPSFEIAIAQHHINAQIRRKSSVASTRSSRSSLAQEVRSETEDEAQRREQREAWERDIERGLGLEERLTRAFARMKPDPEVEEMEESKGSAGDQTPGKQSELAEAQDAQSPEQPKEEVMEQHVAPAVEPEPEPDTYVEPEPVSRFSREEKGKGKAVDERRLSDSPMETSNAKPSLAPVVTVGQNTAIPDQGTAVHAADQTTSQQDNERPSRSYLRSPTVQASVAESKEDVSPASTCD